MAQSIDPPLVVSNPEDEGQARKRKPRIWILAGLGAVLVACLFVRVRLVAPRVLQRFAFASRQKAEADIVAIDSSLEEYSIANGGKYPDSLDALVTPDMNGHTFLAQLHIPKDVWGHEYIYERWGPGNPHPIVRSYGKDGKPGGEGDDADLDNISIRRDDRRR